MPVLYVDHLFVHLLTSGVLNTMVAPVGPGRLPHRTGVGMSPRRLRGPGLGCRRTNLGPNLLLVLVLQSSTPVVAPVFGSPR